MSSFVPIRELLQFAIGGGWGSAIEEPGAVKVGVIRGADFPSIEHGDVSGLPVRYETLQRVNSRALLVADIILEISGGTKDRPTGRTVYIRKSLLSRSDLPLIPASFCRLVRVDPSKAAPRYVYYWLRAMYAAGGTWAYQHRSTGIANFQFEYFLDAEKVRLPSLAEQQAIAEVLGTLDDKIEANGQLRAVCTSLLRATFERLARPGLMAVASGSDLPSGWLRGPLDKWLDVLETGSRPRGGVSKYKHGVPSLGAESVSGLAVFDYSKTKYVPEDYFASMRRGIVQNCDVLLYKDGGRPGQFEPHVAMLGEGFPFSTLCINEHVYRLRARAPMTQEYLFCWLSSEPILEEMRRRGTGVAIPGLNSSAVKALPAGFPANGETAEFSALATDLVKQALSSAKEDRLLAELRDTLLPPLLCGELRVHDAEALVEGAV